MMLEQITNFLFADKLELYFRTITLKRWERIYKKEFSVEDFEVAFKSKEYASKNHPQHFQRKIIDLHNKKIEQFDFASWKHQLNGKSVNTGIES